MPITHTLSIEIPEQTAGKLDLLAQIQGKNVNTMVGEILDAYIEDFTQQISSRPPCAPAPAAGLAPVYDGGGKITSEMVAASYKGAKQVYEGKLGLTDGKNMICAKSGMNPGSAQGHIVDFLAMMKGEEYQRTLSLEATEYYLRHIMQDYGVEGFSLAVGATRRHFEYYSTFTGKKSPRKTRLVNRLVMEYGLQDTLGIEPE